MRPRGTSFRNYPIQNKGERGWLPTCCSDSPLPPLLNVMYCVRVSLWTVKILLAQHKRGRGSWAISIYLCLRVTRSDIRPKGTKIYGTSLKPSDFFPALCYGSKNDEKIKLFMSTCTLKYFKTLFFWFRFPFL